MHRRMRGLPMMLNHWDLPIHQIDPHKPAE